MNNIEIENQQPLSFNSILTQILEKIIASKGWNELYQKIKSTENLTPIQLYKILYKNNGDEEKTKEKIMKRKCKLDKKLKKHNLESQFHQLIKTSDILHPKMVFHVLKRNGGDVELAAKKLNFFSQMGNHKQEMLSALKTTFPNFEQIIEELLLNGYIFPIQFIVRLIYQFSGDYNQIQEHLKKFDGKGFKKSFKDLFKGKNFMMKQFKNHCWGKKGRSRSSSPSSSSDDSDLDNNKVTEYTLCNSYLIENGFKDAEENLKVLKKFNCDKEAALNYLIKSLLSNKNKKEKKQCNKKKHHKRNKKCSNERSSSRSRSRSCGKSSSSSSSDSSKSRSESRSKSKSDNRHRKMYHHHSHKHRHQFHHGPHHRMRMHADSFLNNLENRDYCQSSNNGKHVFNHDNRPFFMNHLHESNFRNNFTSFPPHGQNNNFMPCFPPHHSFPFFPFVGNEQLGKNNSEDIKNHKNTFQQQYLNEPRQCENNDNNRQTQKEQFGKDVEFLIEDTNKKLNL